MLLQWIPLNGITTAQTIADTIHQIITITELISYKKYANEKRVRLVQLGSV
jgi:hypothetical protein